VSGGPAGQAIEKQCAIAQNREYVIRRYVMAGEMFDILLKPKLPDKVQDNDVRSVARHAIIVYVYVYRVYLVRSV
jgi:hypothetical protein